jgi:hypothetical protein
MAFGSGKKPATQGSAGKAYMQPVKKSGTPSGVKKPGKSEIQFGYAPHGVGGSGTVGKAKKF